MKDLMLYVHGKGGNAAESEHYRPLFPDCEVFGLDYQTFTPWETGAEIRAAVENLKAEYESIILIANSIGAFFSMNAGIDKLINKACVSCGYEGLCVQKDDVETIRRKILSADMVVFATPLYYYGMTAQLKTVVDRFCAYNSSLNSRHLKSALLTVAWNADDWTFDALEAHYKTLVRYINFNDMGMVLGYGCGTPSMTKRSRYVKDAYELGRGL